MNNPLWYRRRQLGFGAWLQPRGVTSALRLSCSFASTALHTLAGVALVGMPFHAAIAQSQNAPATPAAATQLAFSIADVHAVPLSKATHMNGGSFNGDRFLIHHATMVDMISLAYGIESGNILGGPSWLDYDRFEVAALAPRDTSRDDLKLMLRSLLVDRFKLVMHSEDKPQPAFVMTGPRGASGMKSRMKPSNGSGTPGCNVPQLSPQTRPAPDEPVTFICRGESMAAFAQFLHQIVQIDLRQPVVDTTGLTGLWDFDVKLPYSHPWGSVACLAVFQAIDAELGLKIAAGTAPLPVMVVDSVNEQPTPNMPGLATAMPPLPPAEFEVATIKPTSPGSERVYSGTLGQVSLPGVTMRWLIGFAWELNDNQMIANPPKWLDEDKFDIVAKVAAPDTRAGATGAPQFDGDHLPGMIRKLLEDRFDIKSHMEDHPAEAYALLADKPKMKTADPQERSGCKEGPGPDGKDPRIAKPILGRLISCQNITMAQFAEMLPRSSNGYIKIPVFDSTELTGNYDFVLSFSGYSQVGGINGYSQPTPTPTDTAAGSSDPTGGLLLFEAIKHQLGLRLEKQKHLFPMVVLDHINRKPTEN